MRKFRIRTCSSNARAAPVPPPEGPEEAAEGSPFTETWEIRAIVAEAVTAALAQAMPRIIVAALTGTHRKLPAAGSSTPGAHRRSSGSTFRIFTPANRGPSRVRNGKGCRPSPIP